MMMLGPFSKKYIYKNITPCCCSATFVPPNLKARPLNLIYTSLLPWLLLWPWPLTFNYGLLNAAHPSAAGI
jgi:hypothetical protein